MLDMRPAVPLSAHALCNALISAVLLDARPKQVQLLLAHRPLDRGCDEHAFLGGLVQTAALRGPTTSPGAETTY